MGGSDVAARAAVTSHRQVRRLGFLAAAAALVVATPLTGQVQTTARGDTQQATNLRLASGTTSGCGTARYVKPNGKAWTCEFADDFNGSTLDPARWTPLTTEATGVPKPECRVDSPENISVSSGKLLLSSVRHDVPLTCHSAFGDYETRYTGGAVTTAGRYSVEYGRVAIRAKMPSYHGVGFHSALWMFPPHSQYGAWPASGEIDINEYRTGLPNHAVPTLHWMRDGEHRYQTDWNCIVRHSEEYHTYVLEWTRSRIRFLFDGNLCMERRWSKAHRVQARRPFDQPFNLILNQSIGGGLNSPDALTPRVGTMAIDWVRIWN